MKKLLVLSMGTLIVLSGCGTHTGTGAAVGAGFGTILGSAIGGISGGPHGSDVGTVVGMVSGAVVGAAVGAAADEAEQEKYEAYQKERDARYTRSYQQSSDDESGFDPTNSGDDTIEFDDTSSDVYTTVLPTTYTPKTISEEKMASLIPGYNIAYNDAIELRNASFVDLDGDGAISAGEECKLSFEIINNSSATLYDIMPTVVETSGNDRIYISSGVRVESLAAGSGVKYTATVLGDDKLKDGSAVIRIAITQGDTDITSEIKEFNITTKKS